MKDTYVYINYFTVGQFQLWLKNWLDEELDFRDTAFFLLKLRIYRPFKRVLFRTYKPQNAYIIPYDSLTIYDFQHVLDQCIIIFDIYNKYLKGEFQGTKESTWEKWYKNALSALNNMDTPPKRDYSNWFGHTTDVEEISLRNFYN